MNWKTVGEWLKTNAGPGAALVGSLLTGNVPAAIAAGVSLVSSATGTDQPDAALAQLQGNPDAIIRLKELVYKEEDSIRNHLRIMKQLELEDAAAAHHETQETIRAGDKAESGFVRNTRPGQSWTSLAAAITYVFQAAPIDITVLGMLLTLPLAYAGLREIGKGRFGNMLSGGAKK